MRWVRTALFRIRAGMAKADTGSITRALLLIAGLAAPLLCAFPTSANASDFEQFRTPSGNIGCVYGDGSLRCDIRSRIVPAPPKPKGCDLDWGGGYGLHKTGRAYVICAGDTAIDPHSRMIAYGTTWQRGAFRCASRLEGYAARTPATMASSSRKTHRTRSEPRVAVHPELVEGCATIAPITASATARKAAARSSIPRAAQPNRPRARR